MSRGKWLRVLLVVVALGLAFEAHAAPEIGWWWNPAESGRGFFVESDGDITFIGGYLYADDGHALWLVAGGANADPYNFSGRLLEVDNGQTLFGDYVPPSAPVDRGAVSVHFSDDQHGTITWPGGIVQIQRDTFGTGTPDFPAFSGWWWNPDESGRGYSVEIQGSNLFVVAFMYDETGKPVWYFSAGAMSTPSTYSGPWLQFANGQTLTGAYRAPTAPVQVGNLDVEFQAADQATFTFSDVTTSQAVQMKRAARKVTVIPQFNKCTPLVRTFPAAYNANITEVLANHSTDVLGQDVQWTATVVGDLVFSPSMLAAPGMFGNDKCGKPISTETYVATGKISVTFELTTKSVAGVCHQATTFPEVFDIPLASYASLVTGGYGQYYLAFNVPAPLLSFVVNGQCTIANVTIPMAENINYVELTIGKNTGAGTDRFQGGGTTTHDTLVKSFHWSFAAVR